LAAEMTELSMACRKYSRQKESLANAIADSIRPAMMPEIEIYSHNDKPLLVLRVFQLNCNGRCKTGLLTSCLAPIYQ